MLARFHGTFTPQVTFGETLVIFTIIFLFAMVVAGVYNGNHQKIFYGHDDFGDIQPFRCYDVMMMTRTNYA